MTVTDEDVKAAVAASNAYWQADANNATCAMCNGSGLLDVPHDPNFVEDCPACNSLGTICIGTEEGAMRAAATTLLARKAEGWLPIETAPKDGRDVLLYHPGFKGDFYKRDQVARTWVDYWRGGWRQAAPSAMPTHWRPLPIPPGADVKEK